MLRRLPEEIWNEETQRLNGEKRDIQNELALLESRQSTDGAALIRFAGRLFDQAAEIWRVRAPNSGGRGS